MLEDKHAARAQQIALQHQIDDRLAALQIVGRIRKDDVELLGAVFQVEKDIRLDRMELFDTELRRGLPDEIVVHRVDLHRRDAPGPPRGELVADRTRPGKEVQHVALLEIDQVAQHVEEVLLGEVRRRTGPQVAGRIDRPALVFAADYSHVAS